MKLLPFYVNTILRQFQHCKKEMDLWVAENEEYDEFWSGSVLNNTFSVLVDWRIAAGLINADNALIVEQDTYLTGDVNFGNEEENDT